MLRHLTQFLFLPFPSRTSRMKYKSEKEEKIRHYQIFNIACEILSSFQSDKTTDFSSILCFAGSFPGARASCFKGELLQQKYNSPQPLGERIAYYNGTTGNVLQQLEKLFCNVFFSCFLYQNRPCPHTKDLCVCYFCFDSCPDTTTTCCMHGPLHADSAEYT